MTAEPDAKQPQPWPSAPLTLIDAHRLVGNFMHHWANLESALNGTIRRILKWANLAMAILSVNLTVAAKIYTARCAISAFGDKGTKWQKAAHRALIEIQELSQDQNVIAHTGFGVSRNKKAVDFYRIKATSQITVPDEIWTPDDFSLKAMQMGTL